MNNLLEISGLALSYHTTEGETEALNNMTFSVSKGEFVAVVGPSGCGKTTVLSVIAGLLKPTAGSVYLDGKLVTSPSGNVGYMLQKDTLFEWLTISDNIRLGLKVRKDRSDVSRNYAHSLLEKYGLADFANHYPTQLSGGMRQRVALIRTLAFKPKLLLLDEPFSALDAQTRLSVGDDVRSIIHDEKGTALLVTHDISEAIALADRVIVLSPRPAHVVGEVKIDLPVGGDIRRAHSEFTEYNSKINSLLKSGYN